MSDIFNKYKEDQECLWNFGRKTGRTWWKI